MSTPLERREWIEALHAASCESDKLLRIIGQLGRDKERAAIIGLFTSVFSGVPIENQNYFLIGGFALWFDDNEQLVQVFRPVEGTTEGAETVIQANTTDRS